jgi:hypothetical protein
MMSLGALLVWLVLIFPVVSDAGRGPGLGEMHTSLIQGDVQIKGRDTSEWVPASINMPLREGDRVWVPQGGRAELYRRDGTAVRLDENTSLELLVMEQDSLQVYLAEGRAYVHYRGGRGGVFQMDAPLTSLRCFDLTWFRADVARDGDSEISVYRGIAYAEGPAGRTEISSGKSLTVRDDAYAELSPLGPADEWERWNRERDERYSSPSNYSYRYLPDELRPYSYDFDMYGRWSYTRDYGYVWAPSLQISTGWSPYRSGRWVWLGGDYVWISYDPWGWVPHHYGRWVFNVSLGWCWVPPVRAGVYWSPGYVGWVYTPQYVSWVPLAPGDTYYGYGHYGPHSVNILNVNINNIQVKRVYKNVHVHDAVTTVTRSTFISGRADRAVVRENLFLRERVTPGSPRIKPEKSSFLPVVKDVPVSKQPPQTVRDLRQEEVKHRRPLVKERGASVLKPQVPQRTMPLRVYDTPKGSESRSYVERESLPAKKARPSEAKKADVKVKQDADTIRRQKAPEKEPAEKLREAPMPSPQALPPKRQGETPQRSVIEQQKGGDRQMKDKGTKVQEAPTARDIPRRAPDRSSPEQPGQKRVSPEIKGQRPGDREVPAGPSAPDPGERGVKRVPGGEPRVRTPEAFPREKNADSVRPNGESGRGTVPKAPMKSRDEEEGTKRPRAKEKDAGGQTFDDRR